MSEDDLKNNSKRSVADEVADASVGCPQIVVLGAGASRAACPNGDKNGKLLPLMADFASSIGIAPLLQNWGIDPNQNFEDVYNNLFEAGERAKLDEINRLVEKYFSALELPDHPTVYDHLVLSLRGQDIIATFNWDPLLLQAYHRNSRGLGMPRLAFLHGNILAGYCEVDQVSGSVGRRCSQCGNPFTRTPLLYPVRHKDYAHNHAIASQWDLLKYGFKNAFMITIFGYSGPKTDQEAISAMQQAWGTSDNRSMEQTAYITFQTEDEITEAWSDFIHSQHYEVQNDFYDSWIANHPRRTGEAHFNQYYRALFIPNNPIPRDLDFPETWAWFEQFRSAEESARSQ